MGRACWQPRCRQIIFLLCIHSRCGKDKCKPMCCSWSNYSLDIFASPWISVFIPQDLVFFLEQPCMSTAWQVRANTQWVITACKATQGDACRLLSTNYSLGHRCVSRPTKLSAVPPSRRLNWDGGSKKGSGKQDLALHCLKLTNQWAPLWLAYEHQDPSSCSAAEVLLPDLKNKKKGRLHLFSVSAPPRIKRGRHFQRSCLTESDSLKRFVFTSLPPSFVHTSSRHGMWNSSGLA